MARLPQVKSKLKVQVASTKIRKDGPAFYIVPPLVVAAVFAFCALVPKDVKKTKAAHAPAAAASATALGAAAKPVADKAPKAGALAMADPNTSLPEFSIPSGSENVLEGAEHVTVSAPGKEGKPVNAIDGSCENDANVAVAAPAGGSPAWWQVSAPEGKSFTGETIVVYGGGSKSPAGKLCGGFRVEVELDGGATLSRDFNAPGFALEGHETWPLGGNQNVKSIRVSGLKAGRNIVLREVQLIGPAGAEN